MDDATLKLVLPFIRIFFANFFRVGLIALRELAGDVASRDASDQCPPIDTHQSREIHSTGSASKSRA